MSPGSERVLNLLRGGRWWTSAEIEEICKVTCHSRLSELRAEGHVIEKRRNPGGTGRRMFSWRLGASVPALLDAPEVEVPVARALPALPSGASSGAATLEEEAGGVVVPSPAPSPLSDEELVELLGRHGLVEWIEPEPLPGFEEIAA